MGENMPIQEMAMEKCQMDFFIENGQVVTPAGVLSNATIGVRDDTIAYVGDAAGSHFIPRIDATGLMVLPGFIDLHSDAIEGEIQPRPGGRFPLEVAMVELDKKLASCGITTMYHCISFSPSDKNEIRHPKHALKIAFRLNQIRKKLSVRNRIHARYEIINESTAPFVADLIRTKMIDLFSIMDHTPGQGQFSSIENFKAYYGTVDQLTEAEVEQLAQRRIQAGKNLDTAHVVELTELCRKHQIPMASHDDDTREKVAWVHGLGVGISEFPVTLEAAQKARDLGMHVLMGAPNIVRGKSLTDNLSGRDAIGKGLCNLIGSDYSPSMILHALFTLDRLEVAPFHELINMVSANPARAIGWENRLGSLSVGCLADFVLVDSSGPVPRITKTFVGGKLAFSAG
jgi:alpha-D-ribose 1-methylphosphonate 5-triphosphate diphosphatase